MMNHKLVEDVCRGFAERLAKESGGDCPGAVTLGFRIALGRPPSNSERARALDYLKGDPDRVKGFAWMLLNLDEFLYVR